MQIDYVDALLRELSKRKNYINSPVRTIYIGGGTPSILTKDNLSRLVSALEEHADLLNEDCSNLLNNEYSNPLNERKFEIEEFTIECNPDDINNPDSDVLKVIADSKINRVSMGAQTFSDERLRFLHRRHKADDVKKAIDNLRNIGIENISIDLMFGFPNETLQDWESDIDKALELNVPHISAYSLMYEEGTALYRLLEQGRVKEIDEETSLRMYELLIEKLTANDYVHYEISNFAKPSMQSKHNSSYWNAVPYLGIGAAAHSYNGTSRQWNIADIKQYIKGVSQDGISADAFEIEKLDDATRFNDLVTTALRTREGINVETMCETLNISILYKEYLLKTAQPMIENGLLTKDGTNLHLTRKGLYISDSIMSELVFVS